MFQNGLIVTFKSPDFTELQDHTSDTFQHVPTMMHSHFGLRIFIISEAHYAQVMYLSIDLPVHPRHLVRKFVI